MLDGQPSHEFLSQWKRDVQVKQVDASRRQRTVTLQDPKTGLEVRAVATIYTDTPGVDWTLYLSNHGAKDTPIIEKLEALDVTLNPGVGTTPVLHRLRGSDNGVDDWQPYEDSIEPGQRIEFAPTDGKSSKHACPFFTLQYGGGGVITAIGWSGQWSATTERQKDGKLRLQAGMQNLHLRLHPGESIRSPRILQLYWFGKDPFRAYNLFRSTMLSHIVPRIDGAIVVPPIAHLSTSFYELNESTESNVLSHLESIKGLGFEMFWLDAYWIKSGFPEGTGNWGFPIQRVEPSDRFPRGLRPISDAAHREGMGFLVWFEPERVYKGTYLAKEHPEWVITTDKGDSWHTDNGLLNLGLPEAREYMTKYLLAVIKEYGMDCLRPDYNIIPGPLWNVLDSQNPDRVGLAEIRFVEGLYKMWDDILQAFPHLFIDNCAGPGSQRLDLETASRAVTLWRTDGIIAPLTKLDFNQAALQNQLGTAGLSRYVPFSTSGQMGATPYLFRSGFNAGISFGEDVRPAGYPRDQLKQAIAEGKRIRKYFFGNFYPLNEVTTNPEDWCVLQYHRTADQDGMVLAFRRHRSPYGRYDLALNEIEPRAEYEVTFYLTFAPAKKTVVAGAELQHLRAEIADCPGSLLVEYKRIN
jgi:alpha-galactosidase